MFISRKYKYFTSLDKKVKKDIIFSVNSSSFHTCVVVLALGQLFYMRGFLKENFQSYHVK